ncbi:GntR family transcriptional regulator [Lentilitoribacter sp. EG35]|jgi:DNA-binding GntR family transcriptional regulator|uniref:GntR family transcriptional regulator n=1 Tax=Lentilitoribacter sp. EG35 TaxID=3234192 RepID=UPI003460F561
MPAPLRQIAYTKFRESLFEQSLKPGQFVSQRELCDLLDLPMGAVREALKRLESDGLISLIAQRGIQIADVNVRFINDAFEFRIIIESEAVRRMARNSDSSALNDLRNRTKSIIEQAETDSSAELFQVGLNVDLELHSLLMGAYSNELIHESYRLLEDKIRLIRLNGKYTSKRLKAAMQEHIGIIDALLDENEEAAVVALRDHLRTSWRRSLGQPEDFS